MPDGIKEALCELRFEAGEISEIVIGRLADAPAWRGFSKTRLPGADLPPQIRALDPNAKFQPSFELRSVENPSIVVRIGGNVVSCHVIGKYPGWDHFYPLLKSTVDALKLAVSDTPVSRIGFRYINALTSKDHYVANAKALNLELKVGDKDVTDAFALNYRTRVTEEHICQLTVATPDYVTAPDPFDAYIDIDIFTV
ncbi:MAG: hypothetical protein C0429_15185, partial [Sphingopyxis sp.]|nr:hypothetical protein [Sphingopyxis sp.]